MKSILFTFTILFFVTACQKEKPNLEEPDIQSLRAKAKPTEVVVGQSRKDEFELHINSNGTIQAEFDLEVVAKSSGIIQRLNVNNGSKINMGQLIASLENTQENITFERAQIAFEKAQVQYADDSIGYSRLTNEAKGNLKLKAGLKDAELSLREARINLEKTQIIAPFSGTVAQLVKKIGDRVNAGETIGLIYSQNQLIIEAKVLETDYSNLKKGLFADIFPLAVKDKTFTASLVEINPIVDENGMVQVKLKLNETNGLLPGMNAQCIIRVPITESVLVPKGAVVIKSGRPVVFTYEDGLAKWNYVETGKENGTDVQITSGLESGQQVILTNNLQLAHDAKVSIANAPLISN